MATANKLISSLVFILVAAIGSNAQQDSRGTIAQPLTLTVTAAATGERVRFTAPSSIVQLQLEVYNSEGRRVFDDELRGANVLDWHLQDGQAERLPDGTYLCVVTVKSLSGKITQKMAGLVVEGTGGRLQAVSGEQLTAQQARSVGPVEEDSALTIPKQEEPSTTTVIAHNGEEGQLIRRKGALSFRLGDFFSGRDQEQMRLSEEGNLGIGIAHPQVRLEVDGLIGTRSGIVFPDGTIQTTAASAADVRRTRDLRQPGELPAQPIASRRAGKDGKRVAPDFKVNEDLTINGNIIFTPKTFRDITVQNNSGGLRFYPAALPLTSSPAAAAIQLWGNNSVFPGQVYLDSGAHNAAAVIIRTAGTGGTSSERMRVTSAGNVGIGTSSPGSRLDVAGTINASTQYNIGGNRVLSVAGTNNLFAGDGAGLSNTTGNHNSFFGYGAGYLNTKGDNNSFFGVFAGNSNTEGGSNSFFGYMAGVANTTGGANSFFGRIAGNENTTGYWNSFFGELAGFHNTTGFANSFFGYGAGESNTTEDSNTFIGAFSDGAAGITNATAIGAYSEVTQSNSVVLGSISGVNSATADTNVGIGTTAPKQRLHVHGGNIYVGTPGQGIILKSPDGTTCSLLSIANSGALVHSVVTCP